MLFEEGDYVATCWNVAFSNAKIEVCAVARRPKGGAEWRVTGRVRIIRDDRVGADSLDFKLWFESPPFGTEEEALAAWDAHLQGFIDESNLIVREHQKIELGTADSKVLRGRLSTAPNFHVLSPDGREAETDEPDTERSERARVLN